MGSIVSYTKAALDALLAGKSDTGHSHGGGTLAPYAVAEVSNVFDSFAGFSTSMDYQALRYDAPFNPFATTKPDMDLSWISISATEPWKIAITPGWYSATLEFGLAWPAGQTANAPTSFRPMIVFGGEGGDFNFDYHPASTDSGGTLGLRRVLHSKMVVADGTFAHFSVQCSHSAAGAYPVGPSGIRRAYWQITKWR